VSSTHSAPSPCPHWDLYKAQSPEDHYPSFSVEISAYLQNKNHLSADKHFQPEKRFTFPLLI